jgi:hypothetical protein
MSKTDELIERALSAEDRELLARHGEPGYFAQASSLFRGRLGWVIWLTYLTALAAFTGFGYAFWRMWTADEALAAVRFGVLAVVLFQYSAMAKGFLGAHMEGNRALREIKRVELQVAMLRDSARSG